jgi:hypothetical protein
MNSIYRRSPRLAIATAVLSLAALLLAAVAVANPASSRRAPNATAGSKITLIGEVIHSAAGKERGTCSERPKISLDDGKLGVGSMGVKECGCAGETCVFEGAANLKVGGLKGRLKFHLVFQFTGPLENSIPPKYGSGYLSKSRRYESIRVIGPGIPGEVGKRFKIVLNTRVLTTQPL